MSTVESLYINSKNLELININNDNKNIESDENIVIFLNPINCNKFTVNIKAPHLTQKSHMILLNEILNKKQIQLNLNNNEIDNKNCLLFFGSISLNSEKSFLILSEGRTLVFELNNKIQK